MVAADVGGVAEGEKGAVERVELGGEGGLLDAGGGVDAELCAVEELAGAGADGDPGEAEAGCSGDAVEVVFLDRSAEGEEEAVFEVGGELEVELTRRRRGG